MTGRLGILMSLLFVACTGTDTGNPPAAVDDTPAVLDDFDTGGCKSWELVGGDSALTQKGVPATMPYDAVHEGLQCLVWKRLDDETLSIEITNHSDGCHADMAWTPRAELNEQGGLDLFLDNKECVFAGCGYCIYDLTFEVKVPADTKHLRTRLYGDSCSGERALSNDETLPLGEQSSGVLCVDYRQPGFGEMHECDQSAPPFACCDGKTGGPSCDPATAMPCAAGTECSQVAEGELKCLPTCEADADCSPYPSTHCTKNVCIL